MGGWLAVQSQRRFEILEIPGAGATATVCVARDQQGRRVALKVLRKDFAMDRDALTRTRDEARMLFRLEHPNIVRVEGLLNRGGRPVVVMELVEGCSLQTLLVQGPLPPDIAVETARQIAQALHAAYSHPTGPDRQPMRIVHRDVKPSHILLSVDGQVKLTDFGIAKAEFDDREAVSLYMVHGSQGYMSPERLDDDEPDTPAVDVYALGRTMFELLTGKSMVVSRHHERHDRQIAKHMPYLEIEGLDPLRLDELRGLIAQMCAYDPDARPASAEVATRLGEWLDASGAHADLVGFAQRVVVPVRGERTQTPPQHHPAWAEVAFLHEPELGADEDEDETTITMPQMMIVPTDALDAQLRERLAKPGWADDLDALRELIAGRDDWSLAPLLDLIDKADKPWWDIWSRPIPRDEVAAALDLLVERPEPEVVARARRLAGNPSSKVSSAAKRVLSRCGEASLPPE